jgi:hypothetical protein
MTLGALGETPKLGPFFLLKFFFFFFFFFFWHRVMNWYFFFSIFSSFSDHWYLNIMMN